MKHDMQVHCPVCGMAVGPRQHEIDYQHSRSRRLFSKEIIEPNMRMRD